MDSVYGVRPSRQRADAGAELPLSRVDERVRWFNGHTESVQFSAVSKSRKTESRSRFERRSRWGNPTRCLPPVTTTRTTGIFKRNCTHRSERKRLARILDKTVGSPLTSKTVFWSGSTFPQGRLCSMLLVEQEARRCGSPLPPVVLSSALMFTSRRLRRRVHLQPSAAWPSAS